MKIYLVGNQDNKIGGGWSFRDCFLKGEWEIVDDPKDCDVYFITSASMIDKVGQIPWSKKVVLRIDNALLESRNGRVYGLESAEKITRMEAMKQIAKKADLVVYQSQWSMVYLKPFIGDCKGKEVVIINGSDDELFNPNNEKLPSDLLEYNGIKRKVYLYIRSSNHDNKGWHIAKYAYEMIQREDPNAVLWIIGRFSPENNVHNFDFWNGENYKYLGYIQDKEAMALYMRSADYLLYSFFNDSCSQTLIEACLSGLKIKWLEGSNSGGSVEIQSLMAMKGREALSYNRMNEAYKKAMEEK